MSLVYLNGRFLPAEEAYVPVLDRGFIFGDGVYEVIPAYGRRLFRLDEHLRRLQDSLDAVRIPNPLVKAEWQEILQRVVDEADFEDQAVYLQVTRGVAKRDHAIPEQVNATVFVMTNPIVGAKPEQLASGVDAITIEDSRWRNCHIKAISLLPNILLRQQALDAGAAESILLRDGLVTEGAASNVFAVIDNKLVTPAKGPRLLPGITRDLILELAQANGLASAEQDISEQALLGAEEVWLTSSTKEILPVTRINGEKVGEGIPGPYFKQMLTLFQNYKSQLKAG